MNNFFDAILILGGGVKEDGGLSEWVQLRADKALEVSTKCRNGS